MARRLTVSAKLAEIQRCINEARLIDTDRVHGRDRTYAVKRRRRHLLRAIRLADQIIVHQRRGRRASSKPGPYTPDAGQIRHARKLKGQAERLWPKARR